MHNNTTLIAAVLITAFTSVIIGMYASDYITTKDCTVLGKFRSSGVVYRCKPVEAQ